MAQPVDMRSPPSLGVRSIGGPAQRDSMKVAIVSPLAEPVPPTLYGGTERVVSALVDELVAQDHDVTLFASGDSLTAATLVACCDRALRLNPNVRDALPYHLAMLDEVRRQADEFDIIHFHNDLIHFPLVPTLKTPTLTTLHGRLDLPDLQPFFSRFCHTPLVAISNSQRSFLRNANFVATIPHGVPKERMRFSATPRGNYLAFLGRVSPEKGPDRAIAIATRAGIRLKMAAKIDRADQEYWTQVVRPLVVGNPLVEFIGEIGEDEKPGFLGDALALLFPIDWPEPFGIAMIEAMACGTPVLAFRCGSVPEVVDPGVTGCIVSGVDEAVAAIDNLVRMDRRAVRRRFEERFTAQRMTRDYVEIYKRLAGWSGGVHQIDDAHALRSTSIDRLALASGGGS